MPAIAIVFGVLLIILGLGFYFATGMHVTALIPAFFGVVFVGLGLLARIEKMRMHAMHAAAALGLVGFLFPAVRVGRHIAAGGEFTAAITAQLLMAVLCAAFVILAVKSFIDARRRRKTDSQ